MARLTPGAIALAALIANPDTLSDLAKRIHCTRSAIRSWARGDGPPKLAAAIIMRDWYGIPVDDWGVVLKSGRAA